MSRTIKRNLVVSTLAAGLLVLANASPASAWGGPTNFSYSGNSCSKYSIASNSAGNAGANTVLTVGTGPVKVGFRGGGHLWIAPVSGSGTAISFINQATVNTYAVFGATHQCNSSPNSYT